MEHRWLQRTALYFLESLGCSEGQGDTFFGFMVAQGSLLLSCIFGTGGYVVFTLLYKSTACAASLHERRDVKFLRIIM